MRLLPRTLSAEAAPVKKIHHLDVFRKLGSRALTLLRGGREPGIEHLQEASRDLHIIRRTETTVEREWLSIRTPPSYTVKNASGSSLPESPATDAGQQIITGGPRPQDPRA
jgi:hypothetical protein